MLQGNLIGVIPNEGSHITNSLQKEKKNYPEKVDSETPLSKLYLNWSEKELPERERTKHVHRLHPYLGKYIPQIVEIFLRKYFLSGQTILDPFAGSGTTLVQANELGIHSIGFDISAFNVMLMKAKTAKYKLDKVHEEITDIVRRTQTLIHNQGNFFEKPLNLTGFKNATPYLSEWFAPQALRELQIFNSLISDYEYQDLLKVILSRAARSSRLTTHYDLDFPKKPQTRPYHCYKHNRICSPTTTSFQFIHRYSLDTIKRIECFAKLRTNSKIQIHHQDSRIAKIPLIDGAITSPPYVGLIDYHEQHRYAYELFDLEDRRIDEIGPAASGISNKAKQAYKEGIVQVFRNVASSMKKGGYFIVVAGDKHGIYNKIAEELDVTVEAVVNRHVNRRTGRRSSEFFESIFIWRKK